MEEFAAQWRDRHSAINRLWCNAWTQFLPFLEFDVEIRRRGLPDQWDLVDQRPLPLGGTYPQRLPECGHCTQVAVSRGLVASPTNSSQRSMRRRSSSPDRFESATHQ